MGFNLEALFNDLFEILKSDIKDSKKIKLIQKLINEEYDYAKSCNEF